MLLAMSIWLGKSAFIERTEAFYMIHCSEVNVPDNCFSWVTVTFNKSHNLVKSRNAVYCSLMHCHNFGNSSYYDLRVLLGSREDCRQHQFAEVETALITFVPFLPGVT